MLQTIPSWHILHVFAVQETFGHCKLWSHVDLWFLHSEFCIALAKIQTTVWTVYGVHTHGVHKFSLAERISFRINVRMSRRTDMALLFLKCIRAYMSVTPTSQSANRNWWVCNVGSVPRCFTCIFFYHRTFGSEWKGLSKTGIRVPTPLHCAYHFAWDKCIPRSCEKCVFGLCMACACRIIRLPKIYTLVWEKAHEGNRRVILTSLS
jgi:hypothetical protein